jgi:hypothetical protein
MVLVYGGCEEELSVKGYVDASFDIDLDDSKSQIGYMATSEAASEGVRLCKLVIELRMYSRMDDPVDILCDNTTTIDAARC